MKTLTDYTKNGYDWRIIMRVADVAMSQSLKHLDFEVFRVQSHGSYFIGGKEVAAAEHPPSNEQWGSKGWSYTNRADADAKFCELLSADLQPA